MAPTLTLCVLVAVGVCIVSLILHRIFGRSILDNIDGPPSNSILTGGFPLTPTSILCIWPPQENLPAFFDPDGWDFQQDLEENYGEVVKIRGLLSVCRQFSLLSTQRNSKKKPEQQLYVFDPVALQSMIVQQSDAYEEHPIYMKAYGLLWGPGIQSSIGADHHRYRKIITPAFATGKIREMIPLFYEVAEKARDGLISPFVSHGPRKLDLNNILGRTSLEVIGRTSIGYSFDSMIPGQDTRNEYAETLKELFPTVFKFKLFFPFLPRACEIGSAAFRRFVVDMIPSKTLHRARDMVDLMERKATQLVMEKKEAVACGQLDIEDDSKDIMTLLLKANLTAEEGMFLTEEELVGQTGIMISAATDTTSSALDRIFHSLSLRRDVQDKLRVEIVEAPEHMDYEQLGSLPYLDGFIHEVLRLCVIRRNTVTEDNHSFVLGYPPVTPVMNRETVEDTILPLGTPFIGVDGQQITSIPVPKGTTIYIAIQTANRNRRIWGDDALEFKPERWQNGKAGAQTERLCGIYGNMMTFLGGGRSCLGFQFALLEIKVIVSVLLRSFIFSPRR
ncbi:Cytochrome P450 [Mycena venus]|uniref:Cytochrome P450 n=1 Tax=Mycena venus TaxID=2733690 RepID=A0A8H7CUN9_9AGAR|nr:Cytochrome P450 [Mycena venus]